MAVEYIGEVPDTPMTTRRLMADGKHTLTRREISPSVIEASCSCGLFRVTFNPNFPEHAEEASYMHISKPNLLISGTSDVHKAMRLLQVEEANRKAKRSG